MRGGSCKSGLPAGSVLSCGLFLAIIILPFSGQAEEMRRFKAIQTPLAQAPAESAAALPPIPKEAVTQAVEEIAKAWGGPEIEEKLAASFYDRDRLSENTAIEVPGDARMRVESIRAIQDLGPVSSTDEHGRPGIARVVSVIVDTRIELNDPQLGFMSVPGRNELILEVTPAAGQAGDGRQGR